MHRQVARSLQLPLQNEGNVPEGIASEMDDVSEATDPVGELGVSSINCL